MPLTASVCLRALALPVSGLLALSGCTGASDAAAPSATAAPAPAPGERAKPADVAKGPAADPAKPAEPPKKDPAPAQPEPPKPLPAGSPEAVAKVKAIMNRMDSEVADEREAAWKDLKDMGDLATPALVGALKTGSPAERRNAAAALGLLKDKASAEALRAALADKEADVRWQAARALGELGDAAAKEPLAKLLKDDADATVREHSAYALAALGADEGLAWFKEELKAKEASRRSRAVKALGKYGGTKCLPELSAAVKDPEGRVRTEAVIQLANIRAKEAIAPLIAALGDEDYKIRERARSALEKLTMVDDLGSDKAQWEVWWAANKEKFKVSASGQPEPHTWENAVSLKGDADFKKQVEEAKGLVAVDFHAAANRDCIRAARVLDKLAAELKGKLVICEAEAKPNTGIIKKLGLQVPPTVVIFKDGKRLETVAGPKTAAEYKTIFDEHIAGTRKVDPEKEKAQEPPAKVAAEFPDVKDEADFKAKVEGSKGLLLLDFHADWCVWCHKLTPILNKLVKDYQGKVTFMGIDADANEALKKRFKVEGLPTLLIFRDGKLAETVVGYKPEEELKAILDKQLAGGKPEGDQK